MYLCQCYRNLHFYNWWGVRYEIVFIKSYSQCPADVRHMESVVTLCPCHDNQSAGEDQSTLCQALIGQLASHPASDWLLVR